ncbi:hypothetical protein QMY64_01690 [Phocaeicola dorei]|nr:hypothetical protein QMY64_01690 [Phocaeicola dorei]
MVDDQRFATSRPDVITFMTEPLCDTLTLAKPYRSGINDCH